MKLRFAMLGMGLCLASACTIVDERGKDNGSDTDTGQEQTESDAAVDTDGADLSSGTDTGEIQEAGTNTPGQSMADSSAQSEADAGTTASDESDAATAAPDAAVTSDGGTGAGEMGAGDAGMSSAGTPVVDPAPDAQAPGEYNCDGCPDGDFSDYELVVQDSSHAFTGAVTGADGNGEFYIAGPEGQALSGPIPTDASGNFSFTAPLFCGTQLVKCVWSNAAGTYVLVTEVTRENCVEPDIQLTLSWDELGSDYELHLIKPGGRINDNATDCTWTSCISSSPDWGVMGDSSDDPVKDVDNTGSYGPENIYLAGPEDGVYTVFVEHWGNGDPQSDGQLTFNVNGQTTVATIENLAPQFVWSVGTIEWPSGNVTLDGSVLDCTGSWSSGCQLELP